MIFSNEYLDYWGVVYVAAGLREQGILFQEFLADPREYLKAVELQSTPVGLEDGYQPLLPRQRRVAQALWRRWALETDGGGPAIPKPQENRLLMEAEDGN